jgi:hypothetical protein
MPKHTRAGQKIRWIEMHCVTPFGPDRGSVFRLNDAEKPTICQIYVCQQQDGPIIGNLAGYIALLHLCGVEVLVNDPLPRIEVSSWTVWRSAGLTFTRSSSVKVRL